MNPIHLAQTGIRLVAIYLIAIGISSIPDVYLFVSTYDPDGEYTAVIYGSVLAAILSPAIIGFLLWLIAPRLSGYVISSHPTSPENTVLNVNQLQSSVVVLIGVYLIAVHTPSAISISYQFFNNTIEVNGVDTYKMSLLPNVISANLKVIFGIVLLIGSNFIVRGITKIRTMGTN